MVLFSSTAIALYGYDQGMMSLINTNKDYLETMGLEEESPQVGVIVVCTCLRNFPIDKAHARAETDCNSVGLLPRMCHWRSAVLYSRGS